MFADNLGLRHRAMSRRTWAKADTYSLERAHDGGEGWHRAVVGAQATDATSLLKDTFRASEAI